MKGRQRPLAVRLPGHRRRRAAVGEAALRDPGVRRSLESLAAEVVPAPAGLADRVLSRLGEQDAADPRRALVARAAARYAAAGGLAAAALVALGAGLARRHSRAMG